MEFLSKLWYSAQVMVLGMMIVFVALVILIFCIKVLSALLKTKKAETKTEAPAPAPVVVPEPVAEAAAQETGADPNELIAVITAAIMAYTGSEKSNKTLVVRNIRAAAAKPNAWARAGRADQLSNRF